MGCVAHEFLFVVWVLGLVVVVAGLRRFVFGVLVCGWRLLRLLLVRLSSCLVGVNLIVLCMALNIGCLSLWFGSLLFGWLPVVWVCGCFGFGC